MEDTLQHKQELCFVELNEQLIEFLCILDYIDQDNKFHSSDFSDGVLYGLMNTERFKGIGWNLCCKILITRSETGTLKAYTLTKEGIIDESKYKIIKLEEMRTIVLSDLDKHLEAYIATDEDIELFKENAVIKPFDFNKIWEKYSHPD